MKYDEVKVMCHKAWSERFNYLCIDMVKKMKVNIVFSMKVEPHILNAFPKLNLFKKTITFTCFQMMFQIKDREDMENLNEVISLQDQVKTVRLQDKLGKQKFQEDMRKILKPMTDAIKNNSENITKAITEVSNNNNKTIENINGKVLELMNDKGMIAAYLASSLVNLFKHENESQLKLKKDQNSNRMNDFLIKGGKPVSLYINMLTFRDSNKSFKLDEDLLETITIYDLNVDHSNQQDRKLIYEFAKEMNLNKKQKGNKSDGDKSIVRILKSPAIMASGVTTIFLSENLDELCDRLNLLLE